MQMRPVAKVDLQNAVNQEIKRLGFEDVVRVKLDGEYMLIDGILWHTGWDTDLRPGSNPLRPTLSYWRFGGFDEQGRVTVEDFQSHEQVEDRKEEEEGK